MARLETGPTTVTNAADIAKLLANEGILFESWGVRSQRGIPSDALLAAYKPEVDRLMQDRGYVSADLVALDQDTPNLEQICRKFDKQHHHAEDEVRFTVEGEGVFEILSQNGLPLKFTAEPGDLIVIPANRRHLFYLTEKKHIRCIRLFKSTGGWEALY